LWYDTPDNAIGYAMHSSRSHDADSHLRRSWQRDRDARTQGASSRKPSSADPYHLGAGVGRGLGVGVALGGGVTVGDGEAGDGHGLVRSDREHAAFGIAVDR